MDISSLSGFEAVPPVYPGEKQATKKLVERDELLQPIRDSIENLSQTLVEAAIEEHRMRGALVSNLANLVMRETMPRSKRLPAGYSNMLLDGMNDEQRQAVQLGRQLFTNAQKFKMRRSWLPGFRVITCNRISAEPTDYLDKLSSLQVDDVLMERELADVYRQGFNDEESNKERPLTMREAVKIIRKAPKKIRGIVYSVEEYNSAYNFLTEYGTVMRLPRKEYRHKDKEVVAFPLPSLTIDNIKKGVRTEIRAPYPEELEKAIRVVESGIREQSEAQFFVSQTS